ncbi:MAG: N-acetylneuraminate synthase, partial [Oligoflexales bacterium]|nr:N-acetylneuraminate synthase [Oligoflexales bacterium]
FNAWREMVLRSRELEHALGDGCKGVEKNEKETVVIQRRAIRLARNVSAGERLKEGDLIFLRPCPEDGFHPYEINKVINRTLRHPLKSGQHLKWNDID